MLKYDSLGAQQEPDEDKVVACDWKCREIYEGEEYAEYDGDYFKKEDVAEFFEEVFQIKYKGGLY